MIPLPSADATAITPAAAMRDRVRVAIGPIA
jgi:hypothetical protein